MIVKIRVTSSPATAVFSAAERLRESWTVRTVATALRRGTRTIGAVAFLALGVNTSATLPPARVKPAPAPNMRHLRLEQFFVHYNCPAPRHVTEYLLAADRYGLDYRLLPAISMRETHCGLEETGNNRWGYHPGRQTFLSIEEGIDYVARQLAENPTYKGKTLLDKLFTYNPRQAYPGEVTRIMRQIE